MVCNIYIVKARWDFNGIIAVNHTCNLVELAYEGHRRRHWRLQPEQETCRQRLTWHLIQRQHHRTTAIEHSHTVLIPLLPTATFTAGCEIHCILMSEMKQ